MELIGPALGDYVHHAAHGPALLRFPLVGVDLEFLHGALGEVLARLALFGPGIGDAVDGESIGVETVASTDLHVVVEGAGRRLGGARHEQREVEILSRVDRKGIDLLIGDDPGDVALRGVHRRNIAGNRDGFLDASDRQADIAIQVRADVQHHARNAFGLEPDRLGLNTVAAGRNRGETVAAVRIGYDGACHPRIQVGERERRVSDRRPGRILDDAGDFRIARLRKRDRGPDRRDRNPEQNPTSSCQHTIPLNANLERLITGSPLRSGCRSARAPVRMPEDSAATSRSAM